MNDLFGKVLQAHALPTLLQPPKVDRAVVSGMMSDANVQHLLFVGRKAGKACQQISEFVEKVRSLPKDSTLTPFLVATLDGVQGDLRAFSSNENEKAMPKMNEKFKLSSFSWFQGSITLAQVLTRDLKPGATRLGLVGRCLLLLKNQGMGCEPALLKHAQQLQAGK